jgi:hypothetical protein
MSNRHLVLWGLLGGALVSGADAFACGDKLLVIGRGLRPRQARSAPHPASILVFAAPGGPLPAALAEGGLRKDLESAGHRLRTVGTREELKLALAKGGVDLVVVDADEAAQLEAQATAAPSRPTVLPTLYKPTPAQLAAARSRFQCVLKSPAAEKDWFAVIDDAMRARQSPAGLGR